MRLPATLPVLLATIGAVLNLASAANDPAYYQRHGTWQDTMVASLEALAKAELADTVPPFYSETMRGGDPAQRVMIPLNGARELYLFVSGGPDVKWGVADWADARLVRADGSFVHLHGATNCRPLLGRLENNLTLRSGLYQKIQLNNRTFERGLNVLAPSIVYIPLEEPFERFEAWIGVDDWAGTNGTVRFSVLGARDAAGQQLFELITRDFPDGTTRRQVNWEREDRVYEFVWRADDWAGLAARYARAAQRVPPLADKAVALAAQAKDRAGVAQVREIYYQSRLLAAALEQARQFDWVGLRLAITDLGSTFNHYPATYQTRLEQLRGQMKAQLAAFAPKDLV